MREYESLFDILKDDASVDAFDFADYRNGEQDILVPALRRKGFDVVHFVTGERDSFGPLSRIAICVDRKTGITRRLVYG